MCGLAVPSNWNDRPKDISQENWENLKLAYDDVADIDAFTGGVSEVELKIAHAKYLNSYKIVEQTLIISTP